MRPYTNEPVITSRESLKSSRKSHDKSSSHANLQPNNISNEIKDLLDKLVTYQGSGNNQNVDTKFS